ncbi:hypothetical protein IFR05_009492 [Cadophora sp. M221]|nr:hypothetical protein IFR05_009492 [Cadophora sp. M221]
MASSSSQSAGRPQQQVSQPKIVTTDPTGQPVPAPVPVEPTIKIHYLEDRVQQDANHRVQWSNWMSDGQKRSFYKHVFVLLLSWHPDCDDMAVEDEVKRLHKLFEETYNYEVKSFQIDSREPQSPQAQVNYEVAHFVREHDHKDDSLFIIYYAGHGSPGKSPGYLKISGRRKKGSRVGISKQFVDITWNHVEGNLQETRADVLQIFDCCHASDLGRGSNLNPRSFEHLAASTTPYTRSPGDHSFTSALIWALKDLASPSQESPMFATSKLAKRIYDAPNFPQEQKPSLTTRNVDALHHIILAPIPRDGSVGAAVPANVDDDEEEVESEDESDKVVPQFLSLTFQFKEAQDDADLKKLADHLKMFMKLDTGLQKVQWGALWDGSGPPPGSRMRDIVKKFMASDQSPISARSKWGMISSAVRRKRLPESNRDRGVLLEPEPSDEREPLLSGASSDTCDVGDSPKSDADENERFPKMDHSFGGKVKGYFQTLVEGKTLVMTCKPRNQGFLS